MKRHEALTLKEGDRVTRLQAKAPHSINQWDGLAAYRPAPGKRYYPETLIYQEQRDGYTAWYLDVLIIKHGQVSSRHERVNTQSVAIVPQAQTQEQSAA